MNKEALKISLKLALIIAIPINLLGVFNPSGYPLMFYLLKFLFWFALSFPVSLFCLYFVLKDLFDNKPCTSR